MGRLWGGGPHRRPWWGVGGGKERSMKWVLKRRGSRKRKDG